MKNNAINNQINKHSLLIAASMSVLGINSAVAESAPEYGSISYKYLDYLDYQSNVPDSYSGASSSTSKKRIKVKAHALLVKIPVAGEWLISGNYVGDSISGASPEYHSKSLVKLKEHRDAGGVSITRYLPRGTLSFGVNQSNENDYFSRTYSLLGTVSTEDKNTTFNAGVSVSNDEISSTNGHVVNEKKRVVDLILGVTQVLTTNDIAQLNIGYSSGSGYFSDPYKFFDNRPDNKNHFTVLGRWNHYIAKTDGSSQLSYRYYKDTYNISAHTVNFDYSQPFEGGWIVTPSFRYYTQTAAKFYIGVDPGAPEFYELPETKYSSLDQRLSEYGAITLGLKVSKQINPDWLIDVKYEEYKQKESWALTGNSDGVLEPFGFRSFQFGITRRF
jgi:hypothetical protein